MKRQQVENHIKLALRLSRLAFEQGIAPPTYQFDTEDHTLEFFYKHKVILFWLDNYDVNMLVMNNNGDKSNKKINPTDTEIALELSFINDKRRGEKSI